MSSKFLEMKEDSIELSKKILEKNFDQYGGLLYSEGMLQLQLKYVINYSELNPKERIEIARFMDIVDFNNELVSNYNSAIHYELAKRHRKDR